jgi:hypothetical protein
MRGTTRSGLLSTAAASGLLAIGLVAIGLLAAPPAMGAPAPRPPRAVEHCVLRVTGQDHVTGELETAPMVCEPSQERALRGAGVARTATTFTIGLHYDGFDLTGSSLTVVGSDCLGGWLNLPSTWNNRISSTSHGCPRIRHYDGANLGTPQETTLTPGGNLGPLNNIASSVQYLS